MPDTKSRMAQLIAASEGETALQTGAPGTEEARNLEELSDDDIKAELVKRGLEVRKKRSPKGTIAKPDGVKDKLRISVHLPEKLRLAVKKASVETNKRESTIGEEAFSLWMERNNFRY